MALFRLLLLIFVLCTATPAQSQLIYQGKYNPNQTLQQYFAAEDLQLQRSVIFVFYSGTPCYDCQQAADLIYQVYNHYYGDLYDLKYVNYETDTRYNYMQAYDLKEPFVVVLLKVEYGDINGYKKIYNLPEYVSDPVSFSIYFRNKVNNFLGQ